MGIQSVGGTPGIDPQGLLDIMKVGMLQHQNDQDKKSDREEKQREFNLKQQELDINKENMKSMRQTAAWQSLTEKATEAAQRAGLQWGTPEYDKFIKQQLAIGIGSPDGKGINLDHVKDLFGDAAGDYFQSLESSSKSSAQKTASPQDFLQHSGPLAALFGQGDRYTGPESGNGSTAKQAQNIAALAKSNPQIASGLQALYSGAPPGHPALQTPWFDVIPGALKAGWNAMGPTYPGARPNDSQNMMALQSILQQMGPEAGVRPQLGMSPGITADYFAANGLNPQGNQGNVNG